MVIAAVFGIVIYRVITVSTFAAFGWALIRNNSQVATTGTAVCINFCVIMLLNVVSRCLRQQQQCRYEVIQHDKLLDYLNGNICFSLTNKLYICFF